MRTHNLRSIMNKRIAKAKELVKDYAAEIVAASAAFAVVAFTVWAAKKQLEAEAEVQNQLAQAFSDGKTVLPGPNGSYWIFETQDA
jgi:hypothetical protein